MIYISKRGLYLGLVGLVIVVLGNLLGYSFISPYIQTIFYGSYILAAIYLFYLLREKSLLRIHHSIFIILFIILFVIILRNHVLGFPLLFIFPMLASNKSHGLFKCISWLMYMVICLFFCLTIAVRIGFSRTYPLSTEISPNKKQAVTLIFTDEGALGGHVEIRYERFYGGFIKKARTLYRDGSDEPEIEWVDDKRIRIDDIIIHIDHKGNVKEKNEVEL